MDEATHGATGHQDAMGAVPVQVGHDLNVQGQAADYGAWLVQKFAGTEAPIPLLPFDPARHRATIIAATASPAPFTSTGAEGNTTAGPAPGTTITSLALPQGTWQVQAYITLSGTVTFADINNTELKLGSAVIAVVPNQGSAEVVNSSGPYTVVVPAGGATLSLVTVGAGSGTAAFYGTLVATQQAGQGLVYLGTAAQCLTRTGGQLAAGQSVIVENNQALWIAPDGTNPVNVTVLVERWDSASDTHTLP